jgi:hypothetical protein
MPTGKVDVKNLSRAATLIRAMKEYDHVDTAFESKRNNGFNISVGRIEGHGDEAVVQPDGAYVIVDATTGKLIATAAREIIVKELRSLGVEP